MLTARIKIGSASPVDITEAFSLVYLDSDKRVGAPSKAYEVTVYPEEEGEYILPKASDDAFDYKVKFFVRAEDGDLNTINHKISAFNAALHDPLAEGETLKTYKQVTFYNDHKRHKIVGYPLPIAEASEFWRDPTNQVNDVAVIEWTIRVNKPSLCDFNSAS